MQGGSAWRTPWHGGERRRLCRGEEDAAACVGLGWVCEVEYFAGGL